MRGKDRKRIADGLYLLAAGSHPITFMNVLRTYVLQHIQTTEQAVELLTQMRSINEPAFTEALRALGVQQPASTPEQAAKAVLDKEMESLRASLDSMADSMRKAKARLQPEADHPMPTRPAKRKRTTRLSRLLQS